MNESELNELLPLNAARPPLRVDGAAAVRIRNSRISLDLVVEQYENGMTPEHIVRVYDTSVLADVHDVIAYDLRHRDAVRAYLKRREVDLRFIALIEESRHSYQEQGGSREPHERGAMSRPVPPGWRRSWASARCRGGLGASAHRIISGTRKGARSKWLRAPSSCAGSRASDEPPRRIHIERKAMKWL